MQFIKIFSTILLTFVYLFSTFTFALADNMVYSKNIRALILDKFKKEQYKNIFQKDNVVLTDNLNFFDTQSKIDVYTTLRDGNNEKKAQLTIQKDVLESRALNLEQTIQIIDEDILKSQEEILDLSRKIFATNEKIDVTKRGIEIINKEMYENKKVLLEYITHIYKKKNLISWSDEIDSLKTVLLNSDSLSDVLSDIHFSTILESAWQILVEKHRKLAKDLFVRNLNLKKEYSELKDQKKQELLKRKSQLEKKEFRQKILDFTKGKQELFEQFIMDKVEIDKKLKSRIIQNKIKLIKQKTELLGKYDCKYFDTNSLNNTQNTIEYDEETFSWKTNEDNCKTLNKILTAESQLKPLADVKNPLLWPVNPKKGLSAYFKDPSYEDEVGSSHDAIDIKIAQWSDIIAPADWYITYVKEPKDEWYAYVVLKHTSWFITIYGHVSDVFFKQYDVVKAWQVFARSGGEFWSKWSGLMTTGPHLHFEVRKDKQVSDPLDYLDLTKMEYDKLPNVEKNIDKYLADYEYKYWYKFGWNLSVLDMIRGMEWFRENAYQDSVWIWTIGYGFTYLKWQVVKEWDYISREEAEIELIKKAKHYTNFKNFITVPLNNDQEMALTSFEYNLGRNIRTKPTEEGWGMPIIDMINAGDIVGAAEYLKEFNSAWHQVLNWLNYRRNKEANLLLSGMDLDVSDLDLIYGENEEEIQR